MDYDEVIIVYHVTDPSKERKFTPQAWEMVSNSGEYVKLRVEPASGSAPIVKPTSSPSVKNCNCGK